MAVKEIVDKMRSIGLKIMAIFYLLLQNARGHPIMPALIPTINRRHPLIMATRVPLAAVEAPPRIGFMVIPTGYGSAGFLAWFLVRHRMGL